MELGACKGAVATHGNERAYWVRDLLPGDEGAVGVEGRDVSVARVGGAFCDPVDLGVAVRGADLRGGLWADEGVFVRCKRDGDVAIVGAVQRGGVSLASPGVLI